MGNHNTHPRVEGHSMHDKFTIDSQPEAGLDTKYNGYLLLYKKWREQVILAVQNITSVLNNKSQSAVLMHLYFEQIHTFFLLFL